MLLWIYPILASRFATRFVTIFGKKRGPKGNNHWRKTEIEASLDLILIWWKERELLQRERGKRRSEKCQFGLRETEPSFHVQPNAVSSCPTRSLSTSPTRRGPTRRSPTRQNPAPAHVQPNTVSSCPTRSLSTSPTRCGPTRCGPTRQHGTVN